VSLLKGKDIDWGQIDRFCMVFLNDLGGHDREDKPSSATGLTIGLIIKTRHHRTLAISQMLL
jgi:hypothetical protein